MNLYRIRYVSLNLLKATLAGTLLLLSACSASKSTAIKEKAPSVTEAKGQLSLSERDRFDQLYFKGISEKMKGNYQRAAQDFEDALKIDPENAAALYEDAYMNFDLSRFSEAESLAVRAVKLDKENKWYKLLLSDVYKYEKKYKEAAAVYEELVSQHPENPDYYLDLGDLYLVQKDASKALKTYERAEKQFGPIEEVTLKKHNLYMETRKYDKAIEETDKLLKNDPDNKKYLGLQAATYLAAGHDEKAMEVYNHMLAKDPDDGYAQLSLSDYYARKGNEKQSFDYLKKAFANKTLAIDSKIAILYNGYLKRPKLDETQMAEAYSLSELLVSAHPNDAKAHAIYGDFLYQDKKYEKAKEEYLKSLESRQDIFAVWQNLLFCNLELKDYAGLEKESSRAMDVFPSQPLTFFFNGLAKLQTKKYEEAVKMFQSGLNQTVDNNPLENQFYINLAEAYFRLKKYEESDQSFEKSLEIDGDNPLVLNNYAYYLAVRDLKLDKAEEMSKKSLDREPDNASYLDTYGYIMMKLGKYEEAGKYIKKSLDKEPESGDVNEHYGDVQFKLGHKETALDYWKKAKKYGSDGEDLDKKIEAGKL